MKLIKSIKLIFKLLPLSPRLKETIAYFHGLLFDLEDRGIVFVRNSGKLQPDFMALQPR
jgi:hypothetical protein